MVGVLLGRERVNESLLFGLHLRVYQACLGIVPPGASRTSSSRQQQCPQHSAKATTHSAPAPGCQQQGGEWYPAGSLGIRAPQKEREAPPSPGAPFPGLALLCTALAAIFPNPAWQPGTV